MSLYLDSEGNIPTRVIPNLRVLGYTNEKPGSETTHILQTRSRLNAIEGKVAPLEAANLPSRMTLVESNLTALDGKVNQLANGGNSENNGGGGSGVSQADFLNLLQLVNSQSLLIFQLNARLNYTEAYLKMIDEAIAVEGFPGWNPPDFS